MGSPCLAFVRQAFFLLLMAATLAVVTLNVNGLRSVDKCARVFRWLHSLPSLPDVVCLQETYCVSREECRLWFSATGMFSFVSPGSHHSCGCVVLYCPHLTFVHSSCDNGGRFLLCEFLFHERFFGLRVFTLPIEVPLETSFWRRLGIGLTHLSQRFCVGILIWLLTGV